MLARPRHVSVSDRTTATHSKDTVTTPSYSPILLGRTSCSQLREPSLTRTMLLLIVICSQCRLSGPPCLEGTTRVRVAVGHTALARLHYRTNIRVPVDIYWGPLREDLLLLGCPAREPPLANGMEPYAKIGKEIRHEIGV